MAAPTSKVPSAGLAATVGSRKKPQGRRPGAGGLSSGIGLDVWPPMKLLHARMHAHDRTSSMPETILREPVVSGPGRFSGATG